MNKRNTFLEDARKIRLLGYRVFVSQRDTYGWVVNDKGEIGYFQQGDYGYGIVFGTLHYGTWHMGSGFSLDNWDEAHTEFSRALVDRAFAKVPPHCYREGWCRTKEELEDLERVKKYTANEYFENYWDKDNVIEL